MNLSEPFVRRPVATTLLTIGVALAGAVAFRQLPVSPLPQVDFPTISVQSSLPGASPEVMAATVAMPLERALGRIAGVTEITSSSSLGSTRITLQFELSRDIDGAARDVQAAINASRGQLPTSLPDNPTYRKVNPADAPIMILALTSDSYSQGQMYDAASTILAQKLSQVSGVGQVTVGGSALPAVRVELNPTALNKYTIALADVSAAINAANANRPKGMVEAGELSWQIFANDQSKKAAEYLPLIIAYRNGAAVRLSDVAEVVDSVQDVRNAGSANGRPAVLVIINRQPGANIIETVDRVQDVLPLLRASIPAAINVDVMLERTSTIRAALREVERALAISTALVILVVLLFLRSARATLIPAVAVPVSLIGTFGVMYLAGFSVNNLSLMALTIATGFVVDDAIVVLENVSRHMERGVPPAQAALVGAREVGFTVLSMSLSLIAVFIPILLMGGIVGRLFREFSVTLSVAILVSLLVSLTTTPMMCSRILKPAASPGKRSRLLHWAELVFENTLAGYRGSLAWALRHPRLIVLVLAAAIGLNFFLYAHIAKGFFPQQDTGRLIGFIRADQGISFQAMRTKLSDFVEIVKSDPAVENVVAFTGGAQRNRGSMFIALKPLEQRRMSADQVVARLRGKLAKEPGATLVLNPVQDIRVGGRLSDSTYQFTLQADGLDELRLWTPRLERALRDVPELVDVNTDQEVKGLQTTLNFDRDTAARLGLGPKQIDAALNLAFGQAVVSTIYSELNQYRVVLEVAPKYWQNPDSLSTVWLISPVKGLVPLSAIARWEFTNTSLSVNHQGQFVATTLSFNLPPGVSLSQATRAVQDAMVRIGVPATIHGSFQGTARAFQASLENQPWLILAALVAVYIVLGILYESYVHPVTILSTLPSAGVGALLALMAFGKDFNIIALIGVILLIGIVKKNAIMMIDLALEIERGQGKRPEQAIFEACLQRFRPIMMTTMAALLGAVPLAVGYGYGAELRQPLGISIMGGLILSQLLTLYTTPVVYLYLDRFRLWVLDSNFEMKKLAPLLLLLFTGCAVGPDYRRPAAEAPAAFRELPGEWKQARPRDEIARGKWWEIFGDAQLDRLVEGIDVSNQTLRNAEAQYRQAQAATAIARAAFFPTLEFDASVVRNRSPAGLSGGLTAGQILTTRSGALNASWAPDFWGAVRRNVESARAAEQASAGTLAAARLSLQAQLATAYFQLRVLDVQKKLLEDTVAAYQKSLDLTLNRYKAGVAARVDVVQAETQLKSTQAQMIDLGVQRAQLEHAIAMLLGKPPAEFAIVPVPNFTAAMPPIPTGLPSELLERRPDVASAERSAASANAQIGVAKSAFFPAFTLTGALGSRTLAASQWFTAPARYWSLGPALAQKLFEGGLRQAQVAQAVAGYDAAVATYRQTALTAFQQVEDNLAAIRILEEEAKVQDDAVQAARQSVELTVNQYKAGTVSYLNVVTVQATQLANERTAVGLLGLRLAASVALVQALGGGWQQAN